MRFQSPTVFLFVILLLAACNNTLTGYTYKTDAIYEAPLSGLRVTIETLGRVPAGADISETYQGTVVIEPLAAAGKKVTLTFIDDDQVAYSIDSRGPLTEKWGFRESEKSLTGILAKAGYPPADENEVKETVRAIGGAFAGPKGTIMAGQSKHITVIKVDSSR